MAEKEFHSYYRTVGGGEGERCNYPTRLDMYGCGCQHDCNYCYAKSLLEFRGIWNPQAPRCLSKQTAVRVLDKIPKGTVIRLGGMTDPFQPLEDKYHLTEWAVGELKRRIGYLIVTKGAGVAKCRNLHPQLAHIQVSYTWTEGKNVPQDYEKASPPKERLKAAEDLYRKGFDVQLRISPYVPDYIDLDTVLKSPVDKILVEFLRVNTFIKKTMPYADFTDWTENTGSYQHLPLERKLELLQPFIDSGKRIAVCEDHPDHYEYFKKHINANPDDCCDLRL